LVRRNSLNAARKEKREKAVDSDEVARINAKIKAAAAAPKPEKKAETRVLKNTPSTQAMNAHINRKISQDQTKQQANKQTKVKIDPKDVPKRDSWTPMGAGYEPSKEHDPDIRAAAARAKRLSGGAGHLRSASPVVHEQAGMLPAFFASLCKCFSSEKR